VDMMSDPTEYNVEMNMAWQEYNVRRAIAWMNTRQILDPKNDSPFFTSIETLRPTTPPHVDLRKLRMNWDNIAFLDKEDKFDVTLDDDVYKEYLRLKVLDWSDKGIMRQLGLTRAALEVANAKLAQERAAAREEPEEVEEVEEPAAGRDAYDEVLAEAARWAEEAEPDEPDDDSDDERPMPEEREVPEEADVPAHATVHGTTEPLKALRPQPNRARTWLKDELRRLGLQQPVFARALGLEGPAITTWCGSLTRRPHVRFLVNDWARITHLLERFAVDPAHFAQFGYAPPGLLA
jgi:hypothetical protein